MQHLFQRLLNAESSMQCRSAHSLDDAGFEQDVRAGALPDVAQRHGQRLFRQIEIVDQCRGRGLLVRDRILCMKLLRNSCRQRACYDQRKPSIKMTPHGFPDFPW
ncbi:MULTISPECIES: hypothetical protein [unclassified Rudaea]|uniref:hypothetical protein n=1 Tax=unclassified Rudaea TaxID=2627037 RepID=UPI0020166140|nr:MULTISPECIES: hypothetical protein [unclassified Rudaea]